jgi:hypothetical protein
MSAYEPEQVSKGRERILDGQRITEYDPATRPYFCRGCGAEQRSVLVPRSWYTLTRASGSTEIRPTRLGLYCSLRCIEGQMERLIGIEDDLGDTFDTAPSEFRQRRSPGW